MKTEYSLKSCKLRLIGFIGAPLLALATSAFAQSGANYSMTWSTIDGGGGTSTGGMYALSGTIGQPDAGRMSGGGFVLSGGFWLGISNSGPIPRLRIELADTDVILAWPNPSTGFQLQEAVELSGAGTLWGLVSQSPTIVGSEKQVRLPATGFGRMFRLYKLAP